ncbi:MAG: hypothetical protein R3C56_29480 [Pirellulaceae bacterium]
MLPPPRTLAFVEFNRRRLDAGVPLVGYGAILIAHSAAHRRFLLDAFDGQLWQNPLLLLGLALGWRHRRHQ